jgi:hypothetical protein
MGRALEAVGDVPTPPLRRQTPVRQCRFELRPVPQRDALSSPSDSSFRSVLDRVRDRSTVGGVDAGAGGGAEPRARPHREVPPGHVLRDPVSDRTDHPRRKYRQLYRFPPIFRPAR